MKLTNFTFSENLDIKRVRIYQRMALTYCLFIVAIVGFVLLIQLSGAKSDDRWSFIWAVVGLLAGQNFFIIQALCRVEGDLADIKRQNRPDKLEQDSWQTRQEKQ